MADVNNTADIDNEAPAADAAPTPSPTQTAFESATAGTPPPPASKTADAAKAKADKNKSLTDKFKEEQKHRTDGFIFDNTNTPYQQRSFGSYLDSLLGILLAVMDYGNYRQRYNFDFNSMVNDIARETYIDPSVDTAKVFGVDFNQARKDVENGVIETARKTGVYNGMPLNERQIAVMNAIDKATDGNETKLLQSFWGAESNFGVSLKSHTSAQGDFQFIQRTFASLINKYGSSIISEMKKDGYGDDANTLQDMINSNKIGSSLSKNAEFLSLRNDPEIATYAAKYLIKDISRTTGLDPQNKADFGGIYMSYVTGPKTYKKFKQLMKENPNQDFKHALMNLTPSESGLSSEAIEDIRTAVQSNESIFDVGNSTGPEVWAEFERRINSKFTSYESTIAPKYS
ncbi:MAG: hypothetical protein KTR28_01125 [Micavibrio sp.]|nr:hypothetical protein [Micavibrio sp.]